MSRVEPSRISSEKNRMFQDREIELRPNLNLNISFPLRNLNNGHIMKTFGRVILNVIWIYQIGNLS